MSDEPNIALAEANILDGGQLDIQQIQRILPHRYPFLLIDRVLEIDRKKRIVAIKNVSCKRALFQRPFSRRGRSCRAC